MGIEGLQCLTLSIPDEVFTDMAQRRLAHPALKPRLVCDPVQRSLQIADDLPWIFSNPIYVRDEVRET